MVDVLTPAQRRLNMSRIRGKDTKPEMLVRRGLHAAGFRFRLHRRDLPGRPDLIFPGRQSVIFVHGCFWHGHDCPMFRSPATRPEFWLAKIDANRRRDNAALQWLVSAGWRVMTVWECALRGPARLEEGVVIGRCCTFLTTGKETELTISGEWQRALNQM
jgi:DNA mismatch endonuclease (patch repair protein)